VNKQKLITFDFFLSWFSKALNLNGLNYHGLQIPALGFFLLSHFKKTGKNHLVLCDKEVLAKILYEFCYCFFPKVVYYFPETDKSNSHLHGFIPEYERYQTESYCALSLKKPFLLICTVSSVHERLFSANSRGFKELLLKENKEMDRDFLIHTLGDWGYNKSEKTTLPKTYSARGGIVDIYPVTSRYPLRIEFFGNKIESIRFFNPASQRTIRKTEETILFSPLKTNKKMLSIFNVSDKNTKKLFVNTKNNSYTVTEHGSVLNTKKIQCSLVEKKEVNTIIKSRPTHIKTFIFCNNTKHIKKITNLISQKTIIVSGILPKSIIFNKHQLCFLSSSDLPGITHEHNSRWGIDYSPGSSGQLRITRLKDLMLGEFLVHKNFGIGQYQGLKIITAGEKKYECIKLIYSNSSVLYLPVEDLTMIYKYHQQRKNTIHLSTLGTSKWLQEKHRANQSAKEIIKDIINTQALRSKPRGFIYDYNDDLYDSLARSFPYKETPDQKKAILCVIQDMEKKIPMDRLICGDVGFGKTEIALRAIIKAVSSNKKVFFLAPTTLLADQHYILSKERLGPLGVEIELFSRFKTKAEQKIILEKIANGFVDLVVGTHRLLSPDIHAPGLSLLIVDEEQRFGVQHKEKIKKMRTNIDILTLSATPIPRTLHQALVGIKNISKIDTPPKLRKPIQTVISYFNWEAILFSIKREITRNGQVYFLHNDINTLPFYHEKLSNFFPLLSIAIAHGKMKSKNLESVILSFFAGNIDILLCTTIIESGLDVANANTIIINNAQNFGLSQLYQIRGRVGRSPRQAFCRLFVPRGISINIAAISRLKAMEIYTTLGSGYEIALKDLELRGAGNMFGHEQSGHIAPVGYEMYCDLLKEASDKALGKHPKKRRRPTIQFDGHALISPEHVPHEDDRLYFYQRISEADSLAQIKDIAAELKDRFGRLPGPTSTLFRLNQMRVSLLGSAVQKLKITKSSFSITLGSALPFPMLKSMKDSRHNKQYNFKIKQKNGDTIVTTPASSISDSLKTAKNFINLLSI